MPRSQAKVKVISEGSRSLSKVTSYCVAGSEWFHLLELILVIFCVLFETLCFSACAVNGGIKYELSDRVGQWRI